MSLFIFIRNIIAFSVSLVFLSPAFSMDTYRLTRTPPDLIPLTFIDGNSTPIGFEIDIMEEIAKRADIVVEQEFVGSYPLAFAQLDKNKTDMVMAALSITTKRMQTYGFSGDYFTTYPMTIISKDPNIKTFADLQGKTISFIDGTLHEALANNLQKEFPDTKLMPEDTTFLTIKNVLQGKADAALGDDSVMLNYVSQYKDYGLVFTIDEKYPKENYGILIAKDNLELKEKLDKALIDIKADGTYGRLLSKWYPEKQPLN